ncbi:PTR2 domain-containing protein, partial [Cephalotus follicularis]
MVDGEKKNSRSFWLYSALRCFQKPISREMKPEEEHGNVMIDSNQTQRAGGWKAVPYVLGNETFERLATFGLLANFMVYLLREYHMDLVFASNVLNIWSGVTNFAPLVGAFISDTYTGRFATIAFGSFASLLGMSIVTLTAWMPQLHPPKCNLKRCLGPDKAQLGVLLMGLSLLSVGAGGIRPCSIPFGVDQFDSTTEEGIKGINSFFNWYYTTFTLVLLITQTVVVYIQDTVSWVIGFGIPTVLMGGSIILFFIGRRIYVRVKPEGSVFSGIARVFVAVYKKRHLKLPTEGEVDGVFYDPPLKQTASSKLPLTNQCRFLNKAAFIVDNDLESDGTPANQWRLCSIQQVEEIKCLVKICPIWASGIISVTSIAQQGTFIVSQALIMDRHLGPKFQIPAGSIGVISLITVAIWLPFYDRILVPALQKVTKHEGGITHLQRIGIGIIFSILSMIVAGLIENKRRGDAILHPHAPPISVMWLAPQLILLGFCDAFNIIGQIEFFNTQFPDDMRSIANALFSCSFACASYLSSLLINIVDQVTGGQGHPGWLASDLNAGRLDYFYFLIAGLGVLNSLYFLYCAHRYHYK